MSTPHNSASNGDFAKTVLMPGDPLRAEFIAKNFFEDAVLVNSVRGICGYTGKYKGHPVSVMASGMGGPSIGIYSYELFKFYGVENIIRVGSAGAISEKLKLRDIVAGMSASTNSAWGKQYDVNGIIAPTCSYELLKKADECAEKLGIKMRVGSLFTSDVFYSVDPMTNEKWKQMGILAVEMEAAVLYLNAMYLNKRALALCTISDIPSTGEECTAEERQNTFTQMMTIALETALMME